MRKAIVVGALAAVGCGSVQDRPPIDAPAGDGAAIDAAAIDAPAIDAPAIDAMVDAADLSPHIVFATSSVHGCGLGGVTGANGICQARAQAAGLPGTFKAWLADASSSPATTMTRHLGPYQLVTTAVVAQGWNDLTDGTLLNKIDRTETGLQLGGPGCNANDPTCHFICEGGEVWSNVDRAGNRRAGIEDCSGWTGAGFGTAGNVGKVDAKWTEGDCRPIQSGSLPIFCIQQ
jgi:hypothetical protein